MTARLTVVIPAFNRGHLLKRTLRSVAEQTLRPLSVVLVDNNSSDDTAAVMRAWSAESHGIDVTLVSESEPGAAAARNRGLAEVRTEWTMFFDSDDTMTPDHCERALDVAGKSGSDIVGWNVRYHIGGKSAVKGFYCRDAQYHSLFHGSMATQRYFARTSLFRQVCGWSTGVLYWDDIELGARLLALNPRLAHAGKKITVDVFAGEESITGLLYSRRVEPALVALDAIRRTLGPGYDSYVDLKTIILAADCTREGSPVGNTLLHDTLSRRGGAWRRLWLSAAYMYQRAGGRGTARLFKYCL